MDNEVSINKKKKKVKIIALISVGIVLSITAIIILLVLVPVTGKKLECKSDLGNITIYYNDNTVTGYSSDDIKYNLSTAKKISKEDGCKNYIDRFIYFFEKEYSGGKCEIK